METTETRPNPATLYSKLATVMGAVKRLKKTGFNQHYKYKFATDADVADLVRTELAKANVAFIPSMLRIEREQGEKQERTVIDWDFRFLCGDTGAFVAARWTSEALDSQDKGLAKAATSGCKYFLLKALMISTGDEPDTDNEGPAPTRSSNQPANRRRSQAKTAAAAFPSRDKFETGKEWLAALVPHFDALDLAALKVCWDKVEEDVGNLTPAQQTWIVGKVQDIMDSKGAAE